jgi:hypothetical protein
MASAARGRAEAEERRDAEHESFLAHRNFRWLKIALALTFVFGAGYVLADIRPRPNGGSWYGYTLGTIGALLIVWLAWLGIRKRRITPGRWSLKGWTSAHVYLGLLLLVIGTLHTGFQLGYNVHTLAWVLMVLVIASGIYGVTAYATLPARLSANRGEMTREAMVESLAAIDRQLEAAAQPLAREDADMVMAALEHDPFRAGALERLSGRARRDPTEAALVHISTARAWSDDAATRDDNSAQQRVRALLGRRQSQIAQIRRHMRLKALLEVWLFVHVPLTIALIAALIAHVISVFYYW